jgi:HEAT repeat protein
MCIRAASKTRSSRLLFCVALISVPFRGSATEPPSEVAPPAIARTHLRGDPPPTLKKADIPTVLPAAIKDLLERTFSEDPVERGKAALALGQCQEQAAYTAPFLIQLLRDFDRLGTYTESPAPSEFAPTPDEVRTKAHAAILQLGKPAVQPCLDALKKSAGADLGDDLVSILCRLKDARAIDPLIALLSNRDPLVRIAVVSSLLDWEDPRFIPPLIRALKDEDDEVRLWTAMELYGFNAPQFVPPLIDAMNDKTVEVRIKAAEALGEKHDRRASAILQQKVHDKSEDDRVREASASAVGSIADPNALEDLLAAARNRSLNDRVRRGATKGLGNSKEKRYFEPLVALLKDTHESEVFRGSVADYLVTLDRKRALVVLEQTAATENENEHVRCVAAMSVVEMTDGAIDNRAIVDGFRGRYINGQSMMDVSNDVAMKQKMLRAIVKNGKTAGVRAAGKKLLGKEM